MEGPVNKVTNTQEKNHQQNHGFKKKNPNKEDITEELRLEEVRDVYIPKEKSKNNSYARDPKLQQLLIKHNNKPQKN